MTEPKPPPQTDHLREDVAAAIMDAHCDDAWTGHTLADAALRVVEPSLRTATATFEQLRRATDPWPWMRQIAQLIEVLRRLEALLNEDVVELSEAIERDERAKAEAELAEVRAAVAEAKVRTDG